MPATKVTVAKKYKDRMLQDNVIRTLYGRWMDVEITSLYRGRNTLLTHHEYARYQKHLPEAFGFR